MYVRDCKSKLSKAQTRHLRLEQSNMFQSSLLITFLPRITIFPLKITISAPKIYHCPLRKSISAPKIYHCSHLKNDIFHLSCASVCSSRPTRSPEESLLMPILGPILPNPSRRWLEYPLSMEVFNGKIMGKYRKLHSKWRFLVDKSWPQWDLMPIYGDLTSNRHFTTRTMKGSQWDVMELKRIMMAMV